MADENKNVKRIQGGSRTEVEANLPEKMIALLKDDAIAMRNSDGTVDYAPVEDSDATFNSLQAVNLAGVGSRNIGADENGNIIELGKAVGTLQEVTDEGSTTTNNIIVESGDNRNSVQNDRLDLQNTATGTQTTITTDTMGIIDGVGGGMYVSKDRIYSDTDNTPVGDVDYVQKKYVDDSIGSIQQFPYSDVKDPTGFVNSRINCTYNSGSRTITLNDNGANTVKALYQGVVKSDIVDGWESPAHPVLNDGDSYFLYWDGSSYVWDLAPFIDNVYETIQIAIVRKVGSVTICIKETHSVMDNKAHKEFHNTIGTWVIDRGGFSGFVLNSTTLADKQIDVGAYTLADEDNETELPSLTGGASAYSHFSLSGSSIAHLTSGNDEVVTVGANGRPTYNLFNGSTWSIVQSDNNDFMKVFILAIPVGNDSTSQLYRYVFIMPQDVTTTLDACRAISSANVDLGTIGGGSLPEYNYIGEIIIQATVNNYEFIEVNDILGTRSSQIISSGATPNLSAVLAVGNDANDIDIVNVNRLGIGTPSPDREQHILSTGIASRKLESASGFDNYDLYTENGVDKWQVGHDSSADRYIIARGSFSGARVTLDSSGNMFLLNNTFIASRTSGGTEIAILYTNPSDRVILGAQVSGASTSLRSQSGEGFILDTAGNVTFPLMSNSDIDAAGNSSAVTKGWVEGLLGGYELSFKFAREGFNGSYSGGVASIPYTAFTEDGATLIAGSGVRTTLDSVITAATFQFGLMAGDATAYYRVDGGSWTSLGTVTSAQTYNSFLPLSINVNAGSEVEFGFSSSSSGSFTECTVTAVVRNQ